MHLYTLQTSPEGGRIGIPQLGRRSKGYGLISSVLFMVSRQKQRTKHIYTSLSPLQYKIIACLLYARLILSIWQKLFVPQQARERRVINIFLFGGSIAVLLVVVIVIIMVVLRLRSAQRRKALEQILEMYQQSEQALVRYVMLNHQCSEEVAYQRIATFVKKHVPLDEHSSIDSMLASDRQNLIDRALSLLVDNPEEIDRI